MHSWLVSLVRPQRQRSWFHFFFFEDKSYPSLSTYSTPCVTSASKVRHTDTASSPTGDWRIKPCISNTERRLWWIQSRFSRLPTYRAYLDETRPPSFPKELPEQFLSLFSVRFPDNTVPEGRPNSSDPYTSTFNVNSFCPSCHFYFLSCLFFFVYSIYLTQGKILPMKYPILGVMLVVLSNSLISSAQESTPTPIPITTTTIAPITTTTIAIAPITTTTIATATSTITTLTASVTPYVTMPIAFSNITSVSAPGCNDYAALIIQCQPSIPTTATTQTQKDLPLLQCLCHSETFYSVYTNCTTSLNLTSTWNATLFSTYCQYIESGNVTALSNGNIVPTGNNNKTLGPPLIVTVISYISKPTTTFSTSSYFTLPTSVSAASTISVSIVARLSCTLLMAWTMMITSHMLATSQLFY